MTLDTERRLSECEGKTPYPSHAKAISMAKHRKYATSIYRCRFCRLWNIGHSTK